MSNHAPKIDIGSKLLFVISLVAILAVVYILVTSLINTYQRNSTKGEISSSYIITNASDNLKPIGSSATSAAVAAAPVAARSGKEVYSAVCAVCHKAGVAGAPKLDDKAVWEPRVATGLDALMTTAINGKGAMPARGGNPSVTDEELKATILYMTKEAGFNLGGASSTQNKAPAAEPVKNKELAEKPKKVAVAEVKKKTELAVPPEKPAVPAKPEAPEIKFAPETKEITTSEEKTPVVEEKIEEKVVEAAPVAKSDGAAVYTAKGCAACHGADAKTPIMPLYPKVAGQSAVYVKQQLIDIKSGKRSNGQSVVMKGIMAGVSEDEIVILAEFLSSLK